MKKLLPLVALLGLVATMVVPSAVETPPACVPNVTDVPQPVPERPVPLIEIELPPTATAGEKPVTVGGVPGGVRLTTLERDPSPRPFTAVTW